MNKSIYIFAICAVSSFWVCFSQPSSNEPVKIGLTNSTLPSDKINANQSKIITDTFPSDIHNINFVVIYNPSLPNEYKAEHESGVPITGQYAKDREVDKGQIHFPCQHKRLHDYKIQKDNIVNIITIKYAMDVYDKTDYIFTRDTIFEIHTSTANAGIFTDSEIKMIPNKIDELSAEKYLHKTNKDCIFNDYLFNFVLTFCEKHQIKIN